MKIAGEYEVKSKATGKVVFVGKSDDVKHDWYLQRITLLNRTNKNENLMQNFRKFGLSDLEMTIVEPGRKAKKVEVKEIINKFFDVKEVKEQKPKKPRGKKK